MEYNFLFPKVLSEITLNNDLQVHCIHIFDESWYKLYLEFFWCTVFFFVRFVANVLSVYHFQKEIIMRKLIKPTEKYQNYKFVVKGANLTKTKRARPLRKNELFLKTFFYL